MVRDLICAASPGERAREYLEVAASMQAIRAHRPDKERPECPM